ncbi:hypothetical protein [Microbulbifer sp. ANSA005]|uniref:hypothetical protein n=1 Tax=Microbulbifer sp. ANSA005 TaxID=3243362 RepID=UPI004042224A
MAVMWSGVAKYTTKKGKLTHEQTNRFIYKHIHVIKGATKYNDMENIAQQILISRLNANRKDAQFGGVKPKTANTVVVTNVGGFEQMEAWVIKNGKKGHNLISVANGAILSTNVHTRATVSSEKKCIKVKIELDAIGNKHITHFGGLGKKNWDAGDSDSPIFPFWHEFNYE